jgi:hypothetical protein
MVIIVITMTWGRNRIPAVSALQGSARLEAQSSARYEKHVAI